MNNIETMKLALEALELSHPRFGVGTAIHIKAVATLRQAIEQAQQAQPCGLECDCTDVCKQDNYKALWQQMCERCDELDKQLAQQAEPDYYGLTKDHLWMSITKDHYDRIKPEFRMACYTSPPPRQPLTDEEINSIAQNNHPLDGIRTFARAIEAAHGIKENT